MLYLTVKPSQGDRFASGHLFLGYTSLFSQSVSCLWSSPVNCIASKNPIENQ